MRFLVQFEYFEGSGAAIAELRMPDGQVVRMFFCGQEHWVAVSEEIEVGVLLVGEEAHITIGDAVNEVVLGVLERFPTPIRNLKVWIPFPCSIEV